METPRSTPTEQVDSTKLPDCAGHFDDCAGGGKKEGVQSTPAAHVGSAQRSEKLSISTEARVEMGGVQYTSTHHLDPASGRFNTWSPDKKRSLDQAEEGMSLFSRL